MGTLIRIYCTLCNYDMCGEGNPSIFLGIGESGKLSIDMIPEVITDNKIKEKVSCMIESGAKLIDHNTEPYYCIKCNALEQQMYFKLRESAHSKVYVPDYACSKCAGSLKQIKITTVNCLYLDIGFNDDEILEDLCGTAFDERYLFYMYYKPKRESVIKNLINCPCCKHEQFKGTSVGDWD
jgi:hypothetical protein